MIIKVHLTFERKTNHLLLDFFKPLNFTLAEVEDGTAALQIALDFRPDIIFMDMRMPNMHGLEVTRQLRTQPDFKDIIIFSMSASMFHQQKQLALEAGSNTFLNKPIIFDELLAVMTDYCDIA